MFGEKTMGKRFCFYCRECELKLTLFDDVGKNSQNQISNYYCPNCEKIVYHNNCLHCNSELEKVVIIPESILNQTNERVENEECPRCDSQRTIIVFLGDWV